MPERPIPDCVKVTIVEGESGTSYVSMCWPDEGGVNGFRQVLRTNEGDALYMDAAQMIHETSSKTEQSLDTE